MSAQQDVFRRFPDLPPELREEVWRLCLPHRVRELDQPLSDILYWRYIPSDVLFDTGPYVPCTLFNTTALNGKPPLITQVCRESRAIAFKAGGIVFMEYDGRPEKAQFGCFTEVDYEWRDETRDSPHLNWTATYEVDFPSNGYPVPCVAWEAARASGRGSLVEEYFDSWYSYDWRGDPHSIARAVGMDRRKDYEAFKALPEWQVVVKTIVIHSPCKPAAATGLFGLLGDSRIQIVDVADTSTLDQYYKLAEDCEEACKVRGPITAAQDFTREPTEVTVQRLKSLVTEAFSDEALAKSLRPAVMFRLCTRTCNSVEAERLRREAEARRSANPVRDRGRGREGRGRP